jgi:nucleotide-binding universal stress UspA family protein
MAAERADTLRRELERYAADHDVDLIFVHAHGDAASELLRLATALHADQIVVGRSMKARHNLAGSLGRRLAGKREAPVVVVVP